MRRSRRILALLFLSAALAALDLHLWPREIAQAFSEWLQFGLALGAGALCVRAAQRSAPRGRRFWMLIGLGMLFWAAGQAFWAVEELALHPQWSLVAWDVLFFCSAVPLLLAVGLRPDRPPRVGSTLVFEFVLALALAFHLYLYFGLGLEDAPPEAGVPWLPRIAALRGLVVLGAFWHLVRRAEPRWRATFVDVAVGLTILHLGDTISTSLLLSGRYEPGLLDLGWTAPFVWIGLAALDWDPGVEQNTADSPAVVPEWASSRRGAVLAIGAAVLVPSLYFLTPRGAHDEPLARRRGVLALATTLGVGGLFLLRQLQLLRQVERAQTLREESFRLLFRDNPHPMLVYERSSQRFLEVNEALVAHYGYSREELLSMTLQQLSAQRVEPLLHALLEAGGPLRGVRGWHHRLKDGRDIEVDVAGHDLEFGRRHATLVTVTDVTERRQLEDRLRQAAKMEALGRLAGGIAHDFNNVLQTVLSYTSLLFHYLDPGEPAHRPVLEIDKAAERARRLVRQLLAFSRRQVLNPRTLELLGLLRDLELMLRRLMGEEIEMSMSLAPDLGLIRADRGQIEQMVLNLAVNARDAMPRGGSIRIEASNVEIPEAQPQDGRRPRPGPHVMLAVSDTGPGISPEGLEHAFEPFYTTRGLGEGIGLGLSMVYGIATQSGGFVDVESEPGRGSTFRVYLPRVPDYLARPAIPSGNLPPVGGSETILLVEDEDSVREATRTMLERLGYRVLEAGNGAEALAVATQHHGTVHLLLIDVVMPGRSGPDTARELSALRPEMKVLYASGYADAVTEAELFDPSAAFIEKPFRPDALARRVRELLGDAAPED